MNKEFKLPELPDSNLEVVHSCAWTKVYTADQMNAHALASVEAYKAMNAVPLAATEVDFATCPTCGEDDILAPVKAGAQSVAVPDDIAADSLLESIASRYSELNDPTEFIRNGWGCAGHEDVLAALKELHTIMLNNIEESQPPAPEQAPAAKAASGAMDNTKIRNFRVVIGLPVWEMWGGIFHKTASFARLGVRTVESAD